MYGCESETWSTTKGDEELLLIVEVRKKDSVK